MFSNSPITLRAKTSQVQDLQAQGSAKSAQVFLLLIPGAFHSIDSHECLSEHILTSSYCLSACSFNLLFPVLLFCPQLCSSFQLLLSGMDTQGCLANCQPAPKPAARPPCTGSGTIRESQHSAPNTGLGSLKVKASKKLLEGILKVKYKLQTVNRGINFFK